MRMRAAGQTRQGSLRLENQDALALDPEQGLFLVCDGMGGHAEGGRAADAAAQAMLFPAARPGDTRLSSQLARLARRVRRAHKVVQDLSIELGHQGDMGSTLVALWLDERNYYLATVGDSRAYLWREGKLSQLNEDHTLVRQYVHQGILSPEEEAQHPQRNVLTQALGVSDIKPDLFEGPCYPGDRFLLCSDGVHGVVGDQELEKVLEKASEASQAVQTIIKLVEARQGADDATAVAAYLRKE